MKHLFNALLFLVLASAPALAQSSPLNARYDPDTPTAQAILGHEFGAEITPPDQAIAYLRALEAAQPERIRVFDYATSWEGRDLAYAIIAKPETIARLDAVQADLQRLADPRGLSAEARDQLIASTPAVVWLSYGVHGDEISSTDAGWPAIICSHRAMMPVLTRSSTRPSSLLTRPRIPTGGPVSSTALPPHADCRLTKTASPPSTTSLGRAGAAITICST